jgi:hypothetical protein
MSTHAVGDQEQVAALLSEPGPWFFEARLPNVHCFGQVSDQEVIFVGWSDTSAVGSPEAAHHQRRATRFS